jgi:hypothetical protein
MYDGVSPSEVHRRKVEYSNKGIPESIIVDKEGTSPWYCPGNYVLHSDEDDVVAGTTFRGLKLNLKSFYEEDLKGQLFQLVEELGSDEHRLFEETLKASDQDKF